MEILAAISGDNLLTAVIWIVILALIYFVLDWGLKQVGVPEPFNKIVRFILILFVVVGLVNALLTIAGRPFITF
jgi:hypothetical protein